MSKIDFKVEPEMTCPYCEFEHSDSWELREEEGVFKCENCNKKFLYSRVVITNYHTHADCELNSQRHKLKWLNTENFGDGRSGAYFCEVCETCFLKEDGDKYLSTPTPASEERK